ncbi:MAG: tRNA cyclic N6-threonylcarbamoyladenosine(37) synthase TcdA [Gammaproteobacteria bacterium]
MTNRANTKRFGGISRLYGEEAFGIISSLHVCVVGIGGVGSWAVESLARSGVEKITIIDFDTLCETNINRQIHALQSTLDKKKISVIAERVRDINPNCLCTLVDDFLTNKNIRDYLSPEKGFDYVIDAIDSISYKAALIHQCKRNKIPVITTGGAGGLNDPTQIAIKDLSRTWNDPLASKVRAKLRESHSFSRDIKRYFGVECVFSTQQQVYPKDDGSVSQKKPGIHGINLDCNLGYGAASFVTGTFGLVAASRVINKVVKKRLRKSS